MKRNILKRITSGGLIFCMAFSQIGVCALADSPTDLDVSVDADGNIAAKAAANYEDESAYGGNKSNTSSSSDDDNHVSEDNSNNTVTYTAAQNAAISDKNSITNLLSDLRDGVTLGSPFSISMYPGIVQTGSGTISKNDLANILNLYADYQEQLDKDNKDMEGYDDDIDALSSIDDRTKDEDYDELSDEEKQDAKEQLVEKIKKGSNEDSKSSSNKDYYSADDLTQSAIPFSLSLSDMYANYNSLLSGIGNSIARTDLISGGLKQADTFSGRMNLLANYQSNAMDDNIDVVVIKDYYFDEVDLEWSETKDWTPSDEDTIVAKFIFKNDETGETIKRNFVSSDTITYSGVPAGTYTISWEQAVETTTAKRLGYKVRTYMVDQNTGTVLSVDDTEVLNGYINLDEESKVTWENGQEAGVEITEKGVDDSASGNDRIE